MILERPQPEFTAKIWLLRLMYLRYSPDDRNLKEQIVSDIVGAGLASACLFRLMMIITLNMVGHNDVFIQFDIIIKICGYSAVVLQEYYDKKKIQAFCEAIK